nr:hypothetical protein BaRGS_021044 [Batillaria attramentaria]
MRCRSRNHPHHEMCQNKGSTLKSRSIEVGESRLCGNSIPIGPIAHALWVGADLGRKTPAYYYYYYYYYYYSYYYY